MNSLNEVISVTLRQVKQTRQLTKSPCVTLVRVSLHPAKVKQPTSPPLNLLSDNKIDLLTRKAEGPESYALSERMWSFAEPLGSHSPCIKLKTHYSEQLHCYNNTVVK